MTFLLGWLIFRGELLNFQGVYRNVLVFMVTSRHPGMVSPIPKCMLLCFFSWKVTDSVQLKHLSRVAKHKKKRNLGGGFKYFLFSPLFGEDSHSDQYFFRWVETTKVILQQGDLWKIPLRRSPLSGKGHVNYTHHPKKGTFSQNCQFILGCPPSQ